VARKPNAKLRSFTAADVEFRDDVEQIGPFFEQAAMLVVPLHAGGGTRLKILQAFASGLPVISTSIGAEGLAVEDKVHLLLRDSAESFAQAILELAAQPEQGRELARKRGL